MDKETEIADKMERIRKLAAENKNIDEQALITALLADADSAAQLSGKETGKAYLISILAPPFGLYYAAKFWFRAEADARKAAYICVVLTVISGLAVWWLTNAAVSNPQLKSIQDINPRDFQDLIL